MSDFGNTIALSYRSRETTLIIPATDVNRAVKPNTLGKYNLARTGIAIRPRIRVNVVPEVSFSTSTTNLDTILGTFTRLTLMLPAYMVTHFTHTETPAIFSDVHNLRQRAT